MQAFRPLPLLGNTHVQTVLGNLYFGARLTFRSVLRVAGLPDGDGIAVHDTAPSTWRPGKPVALLLHGLGGSHDSPYMRRVGQILAGCGTRVYRMDLRGAGAGAALARGFYSAACTEDVRAVVEFVHRRHPDSPLVLCGFSLGGGIALKAAGGGALPGVCGVAAVAPPLDLVRSANLLAGFPFYDALFVRDVTGQVRRQQRLLPDLPRVRLPRRLTLRRFDDLFTAPRLGLADAHEYYSAASPLPWIPKIRVPTLIITARDDPFIPADTFEALPPSPHLHVNIAPHGGHLGFLGPDGQGGIRWADWQVVNWLLSRAASVVAADAARDNGHHDRNGKAKTLLVTT
jgi:predicted alpha/beta-fold hydrolase